MHNARFKVKSKRTVKMCFLHGMKFDDRPEFAKRLEKARVERGFRTAKDAANYFGWSYDTYVQHENGTRGIGRAADRYAKAYRVGEGWLLTGEGAGPGLDARHVVVRGFVQAGHWAETWEWGDDERYEEIIEDDPALRPFALYAAEVRGPSMNRRYPEKTVLVFTDLIETGAALEVGKRYIVERERADGMREATVKTLWRDEGGKIWLLPESDDPRFQEPIPIDGGEDDTVRIVGRVVRAISKE